MDPRSIVCVIQNPGQVPISLRPKPKPKGALNEHHQTPNSRPRKVLKRLTCVFLWGAPASAMGAPTTALVHSCWVCHCPRWCLLQGIHRAAWVFLQGVPASDVVLVPGLPMTGSVFLWLARVRTHGLQLKVGDVFAAPCVLHSLWTFAGAPQPS